MDRRAFLMTCSTAAAAAAVGHQAWAVDPRWQVTGEALFPGVPLQVDLGGAVPDQARVRVTVQCAQGHIVCGDYPAGPDARLAFDTPYPFEDLVPGAYDVELELVTREGRVLERRVVGGYRLLPHRFSA